MKNNSVLNIKWCEIKGEVGLVCEQTEVTWES